MAEIIHLRGTPHDEALELLPWFVNGSLAPDEAQRVEAHLAECGECRDELAVERRLATAMDSVSIDPDADWDRFQQRLDRAAVPQFRPTVPWWRRRVSLGWAVASPLAAAAAVAMVVINVPARQAADPQYHALGAAMSSQPANIVVQFQPSARIGDMQTALQSVDARLVDGPTEAGAYLLHVDQTERELALKRLRDDRSIALAQPIDAPARE